MKGAEGALYASLNKLNVFRIQTFLQKANKTKRQLQHYIVHKLVDRVHCTNYIHLLQVLYNLADAKDFVPYNVYCARLIDRMYFQVIHFSWLHLAILNGFSILLKGINLTISSKYNTFLVSTATF